MMSTLIDFGSSVASVAVHWVLFLVGYRVVKPLMPGSKGLQRLGVKLVSAKKTQLNKNPLLRKFSVAVEENRIGLAQMLIGSLIALKGLGMALIGFVFAGLLVVPVQGVMTAALIYEMEKQPYPQRAVHQTIMLQLLSMLCFNALGNIIGLAWWQEELGIAFTSSNPGYIGSVLILVGILLAFRAARKEVEFFRQYRSLIS